MATNDLAQEQLEPLWADSTDNPRTFLEPSVWYYGDVQNDPLVSGFEAGLNLPPSCLNVVDSPVDPAIFTPPIQPPSFNPFYNTLQPAESPSFDSSELPKSGATVHRPLLVDYRMDPLYNAPSQSDPTRDDPPTNLVVDADGQVEAERATILPPQMFAEPQLKSGKSSRTEKSQKKTSTKKRSAGEPTLKDWKEIYKRDQADFQKRFTDLERTRRSLDEFYSLREKFVDCSLGDALEASKLGREGQEDLTKFGMWLKNCLTDISKFVRNRDACTKKHRQGSESGSSKPSTFQARRKVKQSLGCRPVNPVPALQVEQTQESTQPALQLTFQPQSLMYQSQEQTYQANLTVQHPPPQWQGQRIEYSIDESQSPPNSSVLAADKVPPQMTNTTKKSSFGANHHPYPRTGRRVPDRRTRIDAGSPSLISSELYGMVPTPDQTPCRLPHTDLPPQIPLGSQASRSSAPYSQEILHKSAANQSSTSIANSHDQIFSRSIQGAAAMQQHNFNHFGVFQSASQGGYPHTGFGSDVDAAPGFIGNSEGSSSFPR